MTEKKPGLIRRIFTFIGSALTAIRHAFSLLILVVMISVLGGMFAENLKPIPAEGALYIAPQGLLVDQKKLCRPACPDFISRKSAEFGNSSQRYHRSHRYRQR